MIDLNETFDAIYRDGGVNNLENIIQEMKKEGASVVDCIKTIKNKLGLTIPEAECLVITSKAWSVEKENLEKFKEHFYQLVMKHHWLA